MNTDINSAVASAASTYTPAPAKSTDSTNSTASASASAAASTANSSEAASGTASETAKTGAAFSEAAVYEKSSDSADKVTAQSKNTDRSAIVAQLKADQEQRQSQLMDIVKKTMAGQGKAIGQADDMWRFLADGNFTVDPATKAQAQADIAEDGYWGVNQTSDRILDFAKALAGDDPAQADKMLDAFKKGFEQATKSWGKKLPDISQQTYDSVLKKFDDWKNSANKSAEDAASSQAAQASSKTNQANQSADTANQTIQAAASANVTG